MTEPFFYSHPVFRFEEFSRWKAEHGVTDPDTIRKALYYHHKAGHLINIRRGIYAVVPPNATPDQVLLDPYLLAAKAANDSLLAYHTALELHGVAYSAFDQFTFVTNQKIKPFYYHDQYFQSVTEPLAIKSVNDIKFGVEIVNRQGLDILVTNLARTYVDVLDRVELSGGWEEVIRSISNMAVLNVKEVINYCLMLNNHVVAAKVGYFLEQRKGAFAVSEQALQPLIEKKPLTPQSLVARQHREPGQLVKKWNIVLPISVLKKLWEEPNDDV